MTIQIPTLPMTGQSLKTALDGLRAGQILKFGTLGALQSASNLVDGDFCRTHQGLYVVHSAGGLVANGDTVVDLSGSTGQACLVKGEALSDLDAIKADTRDYTILSVGDTLTSRDGFRFEVLDGAASDSSLETTGGVRLQALPSAHSEWDVRSFGAVGDGVTVDQHLPIQKAIDAAHAAGGGAVLIPDGVFLIGRRTYFNDDNTQYGIHGIMLRDNVRLVGSGTLKVQDSCYAASAFYRMISGPSSGASNVGIEGIILDGNEPNQVDSTQCNNVLLVVRTNGWIRNVVSNNANGSSLQIVGPSNARAEQVIFENNHVSGSTNIGIQCTRFHGLTISGNVVRDCHDNGIDVYGEDGTTQTVGDNFTITGNTIDNARVGIFPETVSDGTVSNNAVTGCDVGLVYNRINGEPRNLVYTGNAVSNCERGFRASGDTGGVLVTGNSFYHCSIAAFTLGGAAGNVSHLSIIDNVAYVSTATTPILELGSGTISYTQFSGNMVSAIDYDLDAYILDGNPTQFSNTFVEPYVTGELNRSVHKMRRVTNITSGSTVTIPMPASSGGRLTIYGTSGGAWQSQWEGSFVSSGSRVEVAQLSTSFVSPGNYIASVTGSTTATEIDVVVTNTGSAGSLRYVLDYV